MQRGLGAAGLNFPTPVVTSGADPTSSTVLPASLRAVPGGISRPIRIGDLADEFDPMQALADTAQVTADINQNVSRILQNTVGPMYGGSWNAALPYRAPFTAAPSLTGLMPWLLIGGGLLLVMSMGKKR